MSGHTDVRLKADGPDEYGDYNLVPDDKVLKLAVGVVVQNGFVSPEETKANAARLVACWNAMAGIDDPAAFVRDARELARVTKDEIEEFELRKKLADDFLAAFDDNQSDLSRIGGGE